MGRKKRSVVLRNRKSGYTTTVTPYKEHSGVKITTPASNQQIPVQNNNNRSLQITGTSTDTIP
jgi:hypothetical protein